MDEGQMDLWSRVKVAAADGLVLGIKWGLAAAGFAVVVLLFLGDYAVVRGRATNGQAAYEALRAAQAQSRPDVPPPSPSPSPAPSPAQAKR
jgi:hypothetical protein